MVACARSPVGAEPQDDRLPAQAPLPKIDQYRRQPSGDEKR